METTIYLLSLIILATSCTDQGDLPQRSSIFVKSSVNETLVSTPLSFRTVFVELCASAREIAVKSSPAPSFIVNTTTFCIMIAPTALHIVLLIVLVAYTTAQTTTTSNQTKPLCYSGSTLYQKVTQNCNEKDPSYTGEWYCATIEICESFISKARECVQTRGCATQEECVSATSSSGYYNGNAVQVTSGIAPAGMTITATCCNAYDFPSDDAIAIDYKNICNSASGAPYTQLSIVVTLVALSVYFMHV